MSDLRTTGEKLCLNLDNGAALHFNGELFAEASWFDEDTHRIKRQRLYSLESGAHVYSISEGDGENRFNRGYQLQSQDSMLHISNGQSNLHIPHQMFVLFAQCILESVEANSESTIEHIEEVLKAANC